MDIVFYIALGAGVGFAVGLTGVGGGSLMTPVLVFSGIPINVAVGTDLLYAAMTKASGVFVHSRLGNIRWNLVFLLAVGSIPGSLVTAFFLKDVFSASEEYLYILNRALGLMLVLTSLSLLFSKFIFKARPLVAGERKEQGSQVPIFTIFLGLILGILVTLSSVGAGAFCAALLVIMYPRLSVLHVIGTDITHAVPLTLVAGFSHMIIFQSIDWELLLGLLIGSLPAVQLGAKVASRVSNNLLQPVLGGLLFIVGFKFILS
jgi:uncharacterized membrane protein YfcA